MNSIRETNGNFESCNSCKRLVPSRLFDELHESKFPFVSRIEFIRSKLSFFCSHIRGQRHIIYHGRRHNATMDRTNEFTYIAAVLVVLGTSQLQRLVRNIFFYRNLQKPNTN